MNWRRLVIVLAVLPMLTAPVSAGIFFNRKPKGQQQNQGDRAYTLIQTARSDRSERHREAAIQELRRYDPNMYPEIVPLLIEKMQSDPSADVRQEAAASLGRMGVQSPQAGMALQQAQNDSSRSVRKEAKKSLANLKGGTGGNGQPEQILTTQEPPLAGPQAPAIVRQQPRMVDSIPTSRPVARPGAPVSGPDLPDPGATIPAGAPKPLPKGPSQPRLTPTPPPHDLVKPPPLPTSEGPELK